MRNVMHNERVDHVAIDALDFRVGFLFWIV